MRAIKSCFAYVNMETKTDKLNTIINLLALSQVLNGYSVVRLRGRRLQRDGGRGCCAFVRKNKDLHVVLA